VTGTTALTGEAPETDLLRKPTIKGLPERDEVGKKESFKTAAAGPGKKKNSRGRIVRSRKGIGSDKKRKN